MRKFFKDLFQVTINMEDPRGVFPFTRAEDYLNSKGYEVAIHGSTLCCRKAGSWRPFRAGELERVIRDYMCSANIGHRFHRDIVENFAAWLRAGAETLPVGTVVKQDDRSTKDLLGARPC
jgi:hypothetical protein